MAQNTDNTPKIASREEWLEARNALLEKEKELTHQSDALAQERQALPWVRVEKEYTFDTDDGPRTLADLFGGRSQLMIYHFMYGPDYEAGCPTCSSMTDGLDGLLPHLKARDVTFVLVSRAPLSELQAYKKRMGWSIPWVSSGNNDFSFDFGVAATAEQMREIAPPVSELPLIASQNAEATGTDVYSYIAEAPNMLAFTLKDGDVFQTYEAGGRGVEFLMGYYPILDRAPKGRDEGEDFQTWIRRKDEYDG